MSQTALHSWQPSTEAQLGRYNSVETALSFGSPANELQALRTGCGVFTLPWRTQISVTGKDRVRWLHNMVTNNVRDLAPNRGNYNFVLNAQGRILGDFYIYNRGESLMLETDVSQVEALIQTLKRFIIMDKVELIPANGEVMALGICGPQAEKILTDTGSDPKGMSPLEIREVLANGIAITVVRGPEKKPGWFTLWASASDAQALWQKLMAAGAQPVGAEALEMWRVLRGIPNYGQDIRDRDLPQETGQNDALNFTKGCYIGQEIVERIRSRGQVHRKFTGFEFPGAAPAAGKYEAEGRAFAEITSLTQLPTAAGDKKVGLGYVRHEALANGPEISLNGIAAKAVELPFEI
jgi:folate-binding protein YgfZ